MSIFNYLETFSIFVFSSILLTLAPPPRSLCLSLPILSDRNVVVAIIKVGLSAASESGGQKGNKTSAIRGQLPGAKVKYDTRRKCDLTNAEST